MRFKSESERSGWEKRTKRAGAGWSPPSRLYTPPPTPVHARTRARTHTLTHSLIPEPRALSPPHESRKVRAKELCWVEQQRKSAQEERSETQPLPWEVWGLNSEAVDRERSLKKPEGPPACCPIPGVSHWVPEAQKGQR